MKIPSPLGLPTKEPGNQTGEFWQHETLQEKLFWCMIAVVVILVGLFFAGLWGLWSLGFFSWLGRNVIPALVMALYAILVAAGSQ